MTSIPTLQLISALPVRASPSGHSTIDVTSQTSGAVQHFVAVQWLPPGERVYRHTHPVEETLLFLSGSGIATLGDEQFSILPESSLFVPAGVRHGFVAAESEGLRVVVVFPVPYFAETVFTGEDGPPESTL